MSELGHRRPFLNVLLGILVLSLFVLTINAVLLTVSRQYPLETIIVAVIVAICVIAVVVYMGELVVLGWVVDFLDEIGMPPTRSIPLEHEEVGEIVVVTLRDNISSILLCESVQKQLKHLVDEHHCDFVLDLQYAGKISHSLREVIVHLKKAAQKEARKLGSPVALPHGPVFRVFENRKRAVEEMAKHDGHGWVVLCSVPVGIRALAGMT